MEEKELYDYKTMSYITKDNVSEITKITYSENNLVLTTHKKVIVFSDKEIIKGIKKLLKENKLSLQLDGNTGNWDSSISSNKDFIKEFNLLGTYYKIPAILGVLEMYFNSLKPKEHEFKEGDWVILSYCSDKSIHKVLKVHKDCLEYKNGCQNKEFFKLWEPKENELCWFYNDISSRYSMKLARYHKKSKDKYLCFEAIGVSYYENIEPFTGEVPESLLKDNNENN